MLLLSQTLLGESNLIAEFLQLMRVLLSLAAALVLITLFQLFKLSLLLISQLCQTFSRLIQLMAKIFNQVSLFLLELVVVPSELL